MDINMELKGKSIIDNLSDYVVVDVETTGLDVNFCEIIELGAVKVKNGIVVDTFDSLVQPRKHYYDSEENDEETYYYVDDFITSLTGITNEMLDKAPSQADILPMFRAFLGDSVLVGHNISFDIRFIYSAFMNELGVPLTNDYVDTMRVSRRLFPENAHHRLRDTAASCNVAYKKGHRALEDCKITQACYSYMMVKASQEYPDFKDFLKLFSYSSKGIDVKSIAATVSEFDIDHPFYQKHVVFTGALEIPRKEAMQAVVNAGGIIDNSVTKKTNYLVVGSYDYIQSVKGGKTAKIMKAEKLQLDGYDICVISESTYKELLENK